MSHFPSEDAPTGGGRFVETFLNEILDSPICDPDVHLLNRHGESEDFGFSEIDAHVRSESTYHILMEYDSITADPTGSYLEVPGDQVGETIVRHNKVDRVVLMELRRKQ
jgi:hypothetical protein